MRAGATVESVGHPTSSTRRAERLPVWIGLGLLVLFALLAVFVLADGVATPDRLDTRIAAAAHRLALGHHVVLRITHDVTSLGSMTVLAPLVAVVTLLLMVRRMWAQAVVLVAATLASSLVVGMLKVEIGRPRPVFGHVVARASGYAFPSGHATSCSTVFGVLLVIALPLISRRLRPVAVTLTVLVVAAVCTSRVVLGVHWTSDVIAGSCLGGALTCAAIVVLRAAAPTRRNSGAALQP